MPILQKQCEAQPSYADPRKELPNNGGSSPSLKEARQVTLELVERGLGPVGSVEVQLVTWDACADLLFWVLGFRPPPQTPWPRAKPPRPPALAVALAPASRAQNANTLTQNIFIDQH